MRSHNETGNPELAKTLLMGVALGAFLLAPSSIPGAVSADGGTIYDFGPRLLEQKVRDAQLIVIGIAIPFGNKVAAVPGSNWPLVLRNLRLEVRESLWPPSFTNRNDIIFPYTFLDDARASSWTRTNTPGVFFLTTNLDSRVGEWDKLDRFDDWIEPTSNALAVLFSIEKQKGKSATTTLQVPEAPLPKASRYHQDPNTRSIYLWSFRDGYYDALLGKHGFVVFAPDTEEDRAKVIGHADGQLAGDSARAEWMRKLQTLLR